MKLKFLRFDSVIDVSSRWVSVLQVEDRSLFAGIVESLQSERGEEAKEPYSLWDDKGKAVNPKKALVLLDALPAVPLDSKTLLSKLYQVVARAIADGDEGEGDLPDYVRRLVDYFEAMNEGLWGSYAFGVSWSPEQFLKSFGFEPIIEPESSLLEKCIAFFGLCADIGVNSPLVLVNVKSFLSLNDLEELYSQAFFYGISLVLLESWQDEHELPSEHKIVIDQWFLESSNSVQLK